MLSESAPQNTDSRILRRAITKNSMSYKKKKKYFAKIMLTFYLYLFYYFFCRFGRITNTKKKKIECQQTVVLKHRRVVKEICVHLVHYLKLLQTTHYHSQVAHSRQYNVQFLLYCIIILHIFLEAFI